MLLVLDPTTTALELTAGNLDCRENGGDRTLGPWGYARTRWLRLGPGRTERHTPRRARCRTCRRIHVLVPARSYPRRPDTAETVGDALLAAVEGHGYLRRARGTTPPSATVIAIAPNRAFRGARSGTGPPDQIRNAPAAARAIATLGTDLAPTDGPVRSCGRPWQSKSQAATPTSMRICLNNIQDISQRQEA
jgi:hypothetical protein